MLVMRFSTSPYAVIQARKALQSSGENANIIMHDFSCRSLSSHGSDLSIEPKRLHPRCKIQVLHCQYTTAELDPFAKRMYSTCNPCVFNPSHTMTWKIVMAKNWCDLYMHLLLPALRVTRVHQSYHTIALLHKPRSTEFPRTGLVKKRHQTS